MQAGRLGAAVGLASMLLGGCASITTGKEQALAFDTDPPGAECTLFQGGIDIARFRTPKSVTVRRANNPLIVSCSKPGYHQARAMITTTISDAAWGNLLVGGIIGVMVDSSSGAAYRYYDPPRLTLIAASQPLPEISPQPVNGVTLLPPTTGPAPAEAVAAAPAPSAAPTAPAPAAPVKPAPARAAGTLPANGIWDCGMQNGKRTYKLQFVVAGQSLTVTNYANAPATIVSQDPLTLTAVNPRGQRPMNIVWNTDNTMVVSGPNSSDSNTTFRNEGACTKI